MQANLSSFIILVAASSVLACQSFYMSSDSPVVTASATQIRMPDTPASHQFLARTTAFNSGNRDLILKNLQENFPSKAKDIDGEMHFFSMTGGFEVKKVEESSATSCTGLVQERNSDQFARFTIVVNPAPPHHITDETIQAISRPDEFPILPMSEMELLPAVRTKIEQAVLANRFSGAVLVAKNGKPIFSGAYGFADREKQIPNQLNTRFRIGSMNKMFTAVAILQLVQAGKIGLTDSLGKYLSDYPNKDVASKVTIHHLLTHTGGTGDFFGPEYDVRRLELKSLQDYVNLYGNRPLAFEPGDHWEYSNYGFLLLGRVIERVSGQSYYDYVNDHLFIPTGMTSSGSLPEGEQVPNLSVGYTKVDWTRAWEPNTNTLPYRGTSAGGGYSTVEDLLRFATALLEHTLLDATHTDLLTSGKVQTGNEKDTYGYGFDNRTWGGERSFGHGGGANGMNGELVIIPQSGYVVVALANMDPPAANALTSYISSRLPVNR